MEALLTQMWERGIEPKRGFCLLVGDGAAGLEAARRTVYWDVAFQRCVFHKLPNIYRRLRTPILHDMIGGRTARGSIACGDSAEVSTAHKEAK